MRIFTSPLLAELIAIIAKGATFWKTIVFSYLQCFRRKYSHGLCECAIWQPTGTIVLLYPLSLLMIFVLVNNHKELEN